MIIKGNNFYPNIEINTKEEAVLKALNCLNIFQIEWESVYAEQLIEEFELDKEDFILLDLSYYYGAYSAYYKPHHTPEELERIKLGIQNHYYWDLFMNTAEKLKECHDNGMNKSELHTYLTVSDLKAVARIATSYLNNVPEHEQQVVTKTPLEKQ